MPLKPPPASARRRPPPPPPAPATHPQGASARRRPPPPPPAPATHPQGASARRRPPPPPPAPATHPQGASAPRRGTGGRAAAPSSETPPPPSSRPGSAAAAEERPGIDGAMGRLLLPSSPAAVRRASSSPDLADGHKAAATLPQAASARRRADARRGHLADGHKAAATLPQAASARRRADARRGHPAASLAATPRRYNPYLSRPPLHLQILPDDLLVEILMRLQPEPIHLFRVSQVCKHWRDLIHDVRFLRHFREFHGGAPPVLGFFTNLSRFPFFTPIADAFAVSTAANMSNADWWVFDCRHGRALLEFVRHKELLVWDLVTGDTICLTYPRCLPKQATYNCTVLCMDGHSDSHSRSVLVALVFQVDFIIYGCVYSSETGVWGEITSIHIPAAGSLIDVLPTALVGNTIYWLMDNDRIIEFDLDKHKLALVEKLPCSYEKQVIIMPTEDGFLGLAGLDDSNLHLWSRVVNRVVSWERRMVIDLEEFLGPLCFLVNLAGYAEDADVIFIKVYDSTYMINLKSMTKIELKLHTIQSIGPVFPYTSFYSPAKGLGAHCLTAQPSSSSAPSLTTLCHRGQARAPPSWIQTKGRSKA